MGGGEEGGAGEVGGVRGGERGRGGGRSHAFQIESSQAPALARRFRK